MTAQNTTQIDSVNFGKMLPFPYSSYSANEEGKIFSHKFGKVKELRQFLSSNTYLNVNVTNEQTGRQEMFCVHVLVLLAYCGPRPHKNVTRHLNGKNHDNRLENLAYGTYSDNMKDAMLHGTSVRKLTDEDVLAIRKMWREGMTMKEITPHFEKVTYCTVRNVVMGRTHKNVKEV